MAASALGALSAAPVAGSVESASRIVDRTVVCRMSGQGFPDPVRFLSVGASARSAALNLPPLVSARNGPSGETGVTVGVQTGAGPSQSTGYVSLTSAQCTSTRLRIPLSSRGLRGGPTGPDRKAYSCGVPARVLIRVRAAFLRPTRFRPDPRAPWQSVARGKIATGSMAVATMPGRKPLFYASAIHAEGTAEAFVAPTRCTAA